MHEFDSEAIKMNSFERRIRAFSIDISMATVMFILMIVIIGSFETVSDELKLTLAAGISYFGSLIIRISFLKDNHLVKEIKK